MATKNGHVQQFVRIRSTTGELIAPENLRPLLAADADERGSNLTEVVIRILSDVYRVPFEAAGRHTTPKENAAELNLRIPVNLKIAIGDRANRAGVTIPTQIILDLCDHFDLAPTPALERRLTAA